MNNIKTNETSFFRKLNKTVFIPGQQRIDKALHSMTMWERIILTALVLIFVGSSLGLLYRLNAHILVSIPVQGGALVEGVIGVPRSINPLLATSQSDRDLTMLIYSGLMRATAEGDLVPDLARSYDVSEDGKIYTFTLRDNATWHDGEVVTSDDIIFTVQMAQDSIIKSVHRASWDGVSIERVDARTIRFILEQPYSPFLYNTTLGILPKHLWDDVDPEFFGYHKLNDSPVGSGPYKIKSIKRDRDGIPIHYDLTAFEHYALGSPFITNLRLRFYPNELALIDALIAEEVMNINSVSPESVAQFLETHEVINTPLPRVFGAFFNQNQQTVFTDRIARRILDESVDRALIIDSVLEGYGTAIRGPIPPTSLGYTPVPVDSRGYEQRIDEANAALEDGGWTKNVSGIRSKEIDGDVYELNFSIATSDTPELMEAAALLANTWEKLGAVVSVEIFEKGDLEQHVIRPRKYDVLLFGEIIGRDSDLYAFWHSSQRLDPGLNIALYTNITVDQALEYARTTTNTEERIAEYEAAQKEIRFDIPAAFLYTPDFIYITDPEVQGISVKTITIPAERFLNVHEWFIETDMIWNTFAQSNAVID